MNINWTIILIAGAVLAVLLFLVVKKNQKDKKELENKLKEDYRKSKDEEGDIEIEDGKSI